jgi:NAD(P)-dependent dehydrogenase (short-subunit alcohol dehydrogenase family)
MRVNLKGVFFGCKFASAVSPRDGGSIVNTASLNRSWGTTPQIAYGEQGACWR